MKLTLEERYQLIEAAQGKREFDTVIKNVELVNVFTGEIYPAQVGIFGKYIAHVEADPDNVRDEVENLTGKNVVDGQGQFLVPGLIDAHVHIESSMMTPENFARTVIPHGTTTVITDPHEIGNVLGVEGVEYMLSAGEDLPMNQFILVPSCVPSAPAFENSGAELNVDDIQELLQEKRVLGLAEVMDFPGVLAGSKRMLEMLQATEEKNKFIQGHSPGLTGRKLSAYLCAGPESDHEIRQTQEAREKLRQGMYVDARESSISRNLENLVPALSEMEFPPNFTLCTDDREAADLLNEGHMNHVVRRAIEEGLEPWQAVRAATLNTAKENNIKRLGAVAPGYVADLILVPSLEEMQPTKVFYQGKQVAEAGELTREISPRSSSVEKKNTVNLDHLQSSDFLIELPAAAMKNTSSGEIITNVIDYENEDSLFTRYSRIKLPYEKGQLKLKNVESLNTVAVFNRYSGENKTLGVIKDFGIKEGTLASTVSHDCHNLTVVSSRIDDAVLAANTLIDSGGGLVCVKDGDILAHVKLPVAGLMSTLPAEKISIALRDFKDSLVKIGMEANQPLLKIVTLTLAVIPEAKITNRGLLSVSKQEFVSLFPEISND